MAFSNQQSYIAAISARFVQLQHGDIDKRVEVKPYVLDDQMCDECQGSRCGGKFAPFFCANVTCLQVDFYFHFGWISIYVKDLILQLFPFQTSMIFIKLCVSLFFFFFIGTVLLWTLLDNNSFETRSWVSQATCKGGCWSATCCTVSLVLTESIAVFVKTKNKSEHLVAVAISQVTLQQPNK